MKDKIEKFVNEIGKESLIKYLTEIVSDNKTKTKEQLIEEFFLSILYSLRIQINKNYPNSIFYKKNDLIFIEQNFKNKCFYFRYPDFWSVFETKFKLNYREVQNILKDLLKKHFQIENFKTNTQNKMLMSFLGKLLIIDEFTVKHLSIISCEEEEKYLNS